MLENIYFLHDIFVYMLQKKITVENTTNELIVHTVYAW